MLYEIRVRPNCDPKSCHVLPTPAPLLSLSAVLIGHLLPLWQTEVQQKAQAAKQRGKNECHSFSHSFIPSLAFAIPVHFVHAIKPGIGPDSPQLHFLSFSHSLLPPHLCEPVKLITIYIVYRLVLRFALYRSLSLRRQINSMFFNSIFKYFTRPNARSPRAQVTSHTLASAR